MDYEFEEVSSLTNRQLAQRMKQQFNYECGPVTPSTRSVYIAKYMSFLKEKNSPSNSLKSRSSRLSRPARPPIINRKSEHTKMSPIIHDDEPNSGLITEKSSDVSDWTSFSVVWLFLLFFMLIALFYLYSRVNFRMGQEDSPLLSEFGIDSSDNFVPICKTVTDINCLSKSNRIKPALVIFKYILKEIESGLLQHFCSKVCTRNAFKYTILELKKSLQEKSSEINALIREMIPFEERSDDLHFDRYFQETLEIISHNPRFKLSVFTEEGVATHVIVDKDYHINLPLQCRIKLYLWKVGKYSFLCGIVVLIASLLYKYINYKRKCNLEEKKIIEELVQKCLDRLQSRKEPTSIAVVDLKSSLLTPLQRKDKYWIKIWNSVIDLIEKNECRVKVAVEQIDGEDFKTWKWSMDKEVGDEGCSSIMKTGSIEWQGLAFGDENGTSSNDSISNRQTRPRGSCNGSTNTPFRAPTKYLKVRNMFDNEIQRSDPKNWEANIMNAILEKCCNQSPTKQHGILHLSIDDQNSAEGCVYIKCDSIESAAVAFEALHGWWCERKLVSVKFLKEDRYYERFPSAATMTSPLPFNKTPHRSL